MQRGICNDRWGIEFSIGNQGRFLVNVTEERPREVGRALEAGSSKCKTAGECACHVHKAAGSWKLVSLGRIVAAGVS